MVHYRLQHITRHLILLTFLITSCNKSQKHRDAEETQSGQSLQEVTSKASNVGSNLSYDTVKFIKPADFKFSNLTEFDLSKWHENELFQGLKTPTADQLKRYIPEKAEEALENFKLYSLQKLQTDLKIITILEGTQSCCMDLHYLVYDGNNQLLSDNLVAGTGGDGQWSFNHSGRFINDSTYLFTAVDVEELDLDESSLTQVDSLVIQYRFALDKKFVKMNEEKFRRTIK